MKKRHRSFAPQLAGLALLAPFATFSTGCLDSPLIPRTPSSTPQSTDGLTATPASTTPPAATTPPANTTTAPASTIDLAAAASNAIIQSGYQPQPNNFLFTKWTLQSFTGGSLVQNGATTTTLTGGSSASPTLGALWSQTLVNCDRKKSGSATLEMDVSANSSVSLTSDQGTTSGNTSELGGSTSLTVGYSPPAVSGGGYERSLGNTLDREPR
jgi:hypothetical protein